MTSPTGKILCIDNSGNVYPAMNTKFTDIQVTGNINVGPNQEVTLNEQTIETMPSLVVSHSTNPLLLSVIATGGTAGLLFGKTGSQSLSLNGDFTTAKCHITSMDPVYGDKEIIEIDRQTQNTNLRGPLSLDQTTVPTNVGPGVIYLKSYSDSTYGNPVTGTLLYTDSDNQLKVRNTTGEIIQLSGKPYISQFFDSGGNLTTLFTQAKYTKLLSGTLTGATFNKGATVLSTYSGFTWTGPTRLVKISFNIQSATAPANNNLVIAAIKNGTYNGNQERVTGSVIQESIINWDSTTGKGAQLTIIFITELATNDVINFCLLNSSGTTSATFYSTGIVLEAITEGTD